MLDIKAHDLARTEIDPDTLSDDGIRLKRDQILIDNQLIASITSVVNATILAVLLFSQAVPLYLGIWFASIVGFVVIARLYILSCKKTLPMSETRRRISVGFSIVSGILWGASVFTILPNADPAAQSFVCFVLAGMTAGACVGYATHIPNVIAFNTPALALPIAYLVSQGGAMNFGMAALIAIYYLATLTIVRRSNQQVTASLVNELSAERKSKALEEQKDLLDSEVAARHRSETQLVAILAQARSFNVTLERIFKAFITHDRSSDQFIRLATEELSRELSIERVSVWFFTPDRDAIVCQDLFQGSDASHSQGTTLKAADFPAYFDAINSSMAIVADDAYTDIRTREFASSYLDPLDIKSMLDAPLNGAQGVRGVICCESVAFRREWTAEEVSFVTSIAQFISMSLLSDDSRNLAEALREAMIEAQEASATKSAFLANMSHEIRTPMNGVMGMLDLLRETSLDDDQLDKLDTARTSASVLLEILDGVLDISKLEAGQVILENKPCDPRLLVRDTVALFAPRADSKGIDLICEIDDSLPDLIHGDPLRIKQVLNNLIGNAVKFTNRGQVEVKATATRSSNKVSLRFSISDTGVGIPEDAQATLFQRFVQADSSTTREYGGTGLGLAISQQLVGLMGGAIEFDSHSGKGSTFWFTISTAESQPLKETVSEFEHSTETPVLEESQHILVAEDNPINQKVVRAFLEAAGHTMEMVSNGAEALAAVQAKRYDLILMDVQMPLMDGVTATKAIRSLTGPQRDIPIIALTANAMSGDREKYLHQGMTDYVSKPIDAADLIAKISAVSSKNKSEKRITPDENSLTSRGTEDDFADLLTDIEDASADV